jgi:hypothetical protein
VSPASDRVDFLGRRVSAKGVEPLKSNVYAIRDWPVSKNTKIVENMVRTDSLLSMMDKRLSTRYKTNLFNGKERMLHSIGLDNNEPLQDMKTGLITAPQNQRGYTS